MKVGIITHYYQSENYGGVLQAYALCKYLTDRGIEAEQIQFNSLKLSLLKRIIHKTILFFKTKSLKKRKKFKAFRKSVPHSKKVYSYRNLNLLNAVYDCFICGSDQVWNPNVFENGYSLSFTKKRKYSYAASIASDDIDSNLLDLYKVNVSSYRFVSVRERMAADMLSSFCDPVVVLDPVFLVSKKEWALVKSERMIAEEYAVCYFFGANLNSKQLAKDYCKMKNIKLVYIENGSSGNECDFLLHDVGPKDFLSLLFYANTVFTDSFHAICFSYIFKRNFYVFERENGKGMNSRILDLSHTLLFENRCFTCDFNDFNKFIQVGDYNYSLNNPVFDVLNNESKKFLENVIFDIKELCYEER